VNRSELVSAIADQAGVTAKDADAVLKAFADVVADQLGKREKVAITGFLTFEAKPRAARTARNPRTGAEIAVPATTVPKVTAGSALKAAAAGK